MKMTLRPKTCEMEDMIHLMDAGMKIARLNISHGTVKQNDRILRKFKEAQKLRPHLNIGLMLDLRGREIRTSPIESEQGVVIKGGSEVILRCNDPLAYSSS